MRLGGSVTPQSGLDTGRRFMLTGYLPIYAAVLFVLALVGAGARAWHAPTDGGMSLDHAWQAAGGLTAVRIGAIVVGVTFVALLLQPLQGVMVAAVEGNWPTWLGGSRLHARQLRCRNRLEAAAQVPAAAVVGAAEIRQAGLAATELRRRFPQPTHVLRATALGNALAAAEDRAGRVYGLDTVAAWPRLYPVLGERMLAIVDDHRDRLDASARLSVTMAATAAVSVVVLCRTEWWTLVALLPLVVAVAAYQGAVQQALAYGDALYVAFDLHRFDMYDALAVPRPRTWADEQALNEQLSMLWRQGLPLAPTFGFAEPSSVPIPATPPTIPPNTGQNP